MLKFGYKLMSEEHGPAALVRNAMRAESAGFDFAAISDHFSPWVEEQGHSPMAWVVLGAIANATTRLHLMTAVTCPTMRYHPAVVAQMAATIAVLSKDRFTLGIGAGERLNEHVVGAGWPGVPERQERLSEAASVIRLLLGGGRQHMAGKHFQLDNARLYDLPRQRVPVVMAAGGPRAARIAAETADGLVATEPRTDLVDAYRSAGGSGPIYAEVALSYDRSEDQARKTAHKFFRWSAGGWPVQAELPDTTSFAAASKYVRPDDLAEMIPCGASADAIHEAVGKFLDAGFDHIILTQIGPAQDEFIAFYESELKPELRKAA